MVMENLRLSMSKIMKYNLRKRVRKSREEEDRLSSLPDVILTDILSHLPIESAAATSVLSHRWRRLWTGIACVELFADDTKFTPAIINHILRQLTCRKLHEFVLDVTYTISDYPTPTATKSWFREVCSRNVENIRVEAEDYGYFFLPAFLFNSQSLVTLTLWGLFEFPEIEDLSFNLPNLKILNLNQLKDVPLWLETLISSCPLLEDLDLGFNLDLDSHLSSYVVIIVGPNLESLTIRLLAESSSKKRRLRVSIDAPKLSNLDIKDFNSIYTFVRNPTSLVEARIILKSDDGFEDEEEDNGLLHELQEEYLRQMAKFVGGMSSVTDLELKLESWTNILRYFNHVNLPIFSNLTCLKTDCLKDVLFSLHCFPNLEHLEMSLFSNDDKMEQRSWCAPDSIPACFASKLKTIQITGLKIIGDELGPLAYILSNALVLEKLLVRYCSVGRLYFGNELDEEAYAVGKAWKFCKSLLKLPRSSSTCEVVVSGRDVKSSSNDIQDNYLTCQIVFGRIYVGWFRLNNVSRNAEYVSGYAVM